MADAAGTDSLRARVAAALKRARPAGVVAVDRKGADVHIALTGQRMRWERAAASVVKLDAVRVRMLDGDGGVIEVLDLVDENERLDDVTGAAPKSELAALMRIALDAQDKAVARQQDLVRDVVTSAVELMKSATDRADKLERMLTRLAMERERGIDRTVRELAADAARGAREDDGPDMSDALMMVLAQRLGIPMPPGKPPTQ